MCEPEGNQGTSSPPTVAEWIEKGAQMHAGCGRLWAFLQGSEDPVSETGNSAGLTA